jgi:hypothetical protein
VGGTQYSSEKPQYWFVHTLSIILMALVKNGLVLETLIESEKDISGGHHRIEALQAGIPLSYFLVARKI